MELGHHPAGHRMAGGALLAVMGTIMTFLNWRAAMHEGRFFIKAAMFGPSVFVIGVALIFFKGYRQERVDRGEDISKLAGMRLITARWWAILAVALALGIANLVWISGGP